MIDVTDVRSSIITQEPGKTTPGDRRESAPSEDPPMRGRGGLSSSNPTAAWLIRILDIGPAARPIAPWTMTLAVLAGLAATLLFLDGVFTVLVLESPDHPFAIEANPLARAVMEIAGGGGLLLLKAAQAAFFLGLIEITRRRGLPKSARVISLLAIILSGLLVANSIDILASPPVLL